MRYIAIPQALYVTPLSERPSMTADVCHEADKEPIKTGLLDSRGTPLYRVQEIHKIGFAIPEKA